MKPKMGANSRQLAQIIANQGLPFPVVEVQRSMFDVQRSLFIRALSAWEHLRTRTNALWTPFTHHASRPIQPHLTKSDPTSPKNSAAQRIRHSQLTIDTEAKFGVPLST
jgi:hypothetical protein